MAAEKNFLGYIDDNKKRAYAKLVLVAIALIVIGINIFTGYEYNKILLTVTALSALIMLSMSLYMVSDNWYGVIIIGVIMVSVYSAWAECMDSYLFGSAQSISLTHIAMRGMVIMCEFSLVVMLCIRKRIPKISSEDRISSKEIFNPIIVYGLIAVLLFIFVFGYKRPTVPGERGEISTLYEYSVILFIMGFMYSGRKWYTVLPLTAVALAYCAQDLLYGGRRTSLAIMILLFLVLLSHKLVFVKMIPVALVGFLLLSVVGLFRGGVAFSFDQLMATFGDLFSKKFAIDTMYSAYYTGTAFVAAAHEGLFDFSDRIEMFFKFLASLVLGGGAIPNSNLPLVVRKYIDHWYGGMFPMYGYFYLGTLGTVICGAATGFFAGSSSKKIFSTQLGRVLITWICTNVFAWFLYSPFPLLRGSALVIIAYFVCMLGDIISKKLLKLIFKFEFKTANSK